VDATTLRLLRSQHGRCPLCRCPLLPAEQPPQSPNEWERWLNTTRKTISSQRIVITGDGKPDALRFRLIHTACQRRHCAADKHGSPTPNSDGQGLAWPCAAMSGPHGSEGAPAQKCVGATRLILGLNSSAIGTLVERSTRFTMLLHLPPMDGHGEQARVKNGPALAGHGAEAVRDAIATTITTLPKQLRRSLTWDQGAEMAQHAQLRIDTGLAIYFCDPHSPWQRGTNENTVSIALAR
jgi:hypothetical protein